MAMTLDEYRRKNELTISALAERIGVNGKHRVRTVCRYLRHERVPSFPVLKRIIVATGGQVTLSDFPDRADATDLLGHANDR